MKKYALLLVLSFPVTFAFSQSFSHGVGLSLFVTTEKNGNAAAGEGFTYSPRFNFIEQQDFSLSVGIPLTVGISGSYSANYNSYNGNSVDNSLGFMFNAPLILNFNMGAGSSKDNESRFGWYIGGGVGYHYGVYNQDTTDIYGNGYTQSVHMNAVGPVGNIGIRFAVGRGTHNVEARLLYMKGMDVSKANIFGMGALFNF